MRLFYLPLTMLDNLKRGYGGTKSEMERLIGDANKLAKAQGYIGRSLGCPAVPYKVHKELIETIKDKSCVFIYHPSRNYVAKSKLVS